MPQDKIDTRKIASDVIANALGLLDEDQRADFPAVIVDGADLDPDAFNRERKAWQRQRPTKTEAYTTVDAGEIHQPAWTDTFMRAQQGDLSALRDLAASLVHERAHVTYGAGSEAEAYAAQLDALRRLGADKKTIRRVEEARDYTLRLQAKRTPQK